MECVKGPVIEIEDDCISMSAPILPVTFIFDEDDDDIRQVKSRRGSKVGGKRGYEMDEDFETEAGRSVCFKYQSPIT